MAVTPDRAPKVGDIVIYKHKDRNVLYPGIVTELARDASGIGHLVIFGNFSGFAEGFKNVSYGLGNGQWTYKEESDLQASYDKQVTKSGG